MKDYEVAICAFNFSFSHICGSISEAYDCIMCTALMLHKNLDHDTQDDILVKLAGLKTLEHPEPFSVPGAGIYVRARTGKEEDEE